MHCTDALDLIKSEKNDENIYIIYILYVYMYWRCFGLFKTLPIFQPSMQIVLHKIFNSLSKKKVKLYFDCIRLFYSGFVAVIDTETEFDLLSPSLDLPILTKLKYVCNVQLLLMVTDMDWIQWKVVAVWLSLRCCVIPSIHGVCGSIAYSVSLTQLYIREIDFVRLLNNWLRVNMNYKCDLSAGYSMLLYFGSMFLFTVLKHNSCSLQC